MSSPSKVKPCAVSGCTEARLGHRNYCARHHNASIGKMDPLRVHDLETCMSALLDAMQRGSDPSQGSAAARPSQSDAIPIAGLTPEKEKPTNANNASASGSNAYIRLLHPIAGELFENIRNPASVQPLPGSPLDIFSFSCMNEGNNNNNTANTTTPAVATAASSGTVPPIEEVYGSPSRHIHMSSSESDLNGSAPSPPDLLSSVSFYNGGGGVVVGQGPIVDIKVQFSKQKRKTPDGYELLERTISGRHEADINRSSGGKSTMLCFQRGGESAGAGNANANTSEPSKSESDSETSSQKKPPTPPPTLMPKPITSLCIIFRDASEEPPYGFVAIEKTTLGVDANLNNATGVGRRQVYLCVHRGEGAPIYDLGLILHDKRETLPAGYHEVKHTPFGDRADLNAAMTSTGTDHQSHAPQAVFLCFRPNVTPVLQSYPAVIATQLGSGADTMIKGHLLYAKVLALLTALLYSYDQRMVLQALECFMKIPADSIPPVLLNRFLQCVCDAAPCFQTYFTTQAHTALLKFLSHAFKTFYHVLSVDTFSKMIEVCFLTRHEDKQHEVSEGIFASLISKIERAKPCQCSVEEKADATHIGMNSLAGGAGHSKHTMKSRGSAGHTITTASAATLANAAAAVSSVLCHTCQLNRALAASPLPAFCRDLTLQLVSHVHTAKELESEAKAFQRHGTSGPELRNDIAKLTNQLAAIDQANQAHIDRIANPTATEPTASAANGAARGSIIHSLGALGMTDVPEGVIAPSSPSNRNASASASAFAFDDIPQSTKPSEKDRIFLPNKEERFLQVATLLCAKFASEPIAFGLVKSEQVKRKVHALQLLFYILHRAVYFFRSTPGGILLVRRFICPALMSVCVTDNSQLWRLLLQTFIVLYDQYKHHLMIELGVFFDHILLSLLESVHVTFDLKKDILDMFHHILGKSPQHLVGIFYNYDNHSKNWTIFERLHTVLARITEGEQKSFVPFLATSAGPDAQKEQDQMIEQQEEALQRQALKLLVHNLHMIAQWVGVPSLKRSPDIPSKPLLTQADEIDDSTVPVTTNGSLGVPTTPTSVASKLHRPSHIDTWSFRHDKQKQDQKMLQEALKLARTEKLKSALQYLRIVDPSYAQPRQIAHFLYTNEGLDKAEVGDFLGSCGDKFMDDAEHEACRSAYLEHLDFTGLLFDQALRLFLCDSGFRLPGEAQKIDRLLECFCVAYCRDNPNVFRNHSSAFIVSFGLVMLNTDLHDTRRGTRRQRMTEEQFISNLRGVDDNHDFPRAFLQSLYQNILFSPIEWKEKVRGGAVADETTGKDGIPDAEKIEEQSRAVRKTFEITVRRSLAYLKIWAAHEQGYNRTSNTMIAAGMFEAIWYRTISVITLRSDNYKTGDVDLLHVCLDGLAYGSAIAICLGLPTERQAFSRQLAKITFIERNRESIKSSNMHLRIVQGEHLKQEWYRPFNLMCEKNPVRACHIVVECTHDIKQKINYERRQAKLRQIESDFNHEIVLVDPGRSFVREGPLTKLSNSSTKRQQYIYMLFSDLILYASEGMNSKWKCHRVIHLSLCRIEDLRGIAYADSHAFRIVSPQKSFVVSAPSKEKKQQWIEAIFHHLKLVMAKRRKYIEKATSTTPTGTTAAAAAGLASPSDDSGREELLRRYSTFIGQSDTDLNRFSRLESDSTGSGGSGSGLNLNASPNSAAAASSKSSHCKLCIRPWAIFRRKQKCRYCGDGVCADCCAQKCMIPGGEKRLVNVCDACFGALKGMVGDEVKLLNVVDA